MADRQAEQRFGAEIEFLIEAAIKILERIGVSDVDVFAGGDDVSGDSAIEWNANLGGLKALRDDGPKLFVLTVEEEDRSALGFHFGLGDAKNEIEQFGQVER